MNDLKIKANSWNYTQGAKRTKTMVLFKELNSKSSVIVAAEVVILGAFANYE